MVHPDSYVSREREAKRVRQQRTWRLYVSKGGSKKCARKNRPGFNKKKN